MNKFEVLNLLRELFRDSVQAIYADDDPSGCRTKYVVCQEALMANLEDRIEKEVIKLREELGCD